MSKKFFFHIGLPRCASTTIETVFLVPGNEGCDRLLESRIRPLRNLHDALRQFTAEPNWDDQFLGQVFDQCIAPDIDAPDTDAFFCSDEGLTLTYSETLPPPNLNRRAERLARLLEQFDLTLIILVRNQVAYIQSLYGLHLQSGGTAEFPAFVNSLPLGALDWHAVAQAYANVFGRDRIVVLPFEREIHAAADTPHADFLEAFQGALGVKRPLASAEITSFNPGLPVVMMPVQQQINETIDRDSAIAVADIIRSSLTKRAVIDATLFSPDQANQVRSAFARSNQALFETFMPAYDPAPYLPV